MEIKIRDIKKEMRKEIELLKEEFDEKTSSKVVKRVIMEYLTLQDRYNKILAEYSNLLRDYEFAMETIKDIKEKKY